MAKKSEIEVKREDNSKRKAASKKTVREKITKAPKRTFISILRGGVLNSDFFFRHKLKIFVVVVLIMFFISTKYQCQTGMETIHQLKEKLDIVKAESIRERSQYMSRIRESSMSELADSIRPGLAVQQQPPYVLSLDD